MITCFLLALVLMVGAGFGQEGTKPVKSGAASKSVTRNLSALRSINVAIAEVESALLDRRAKLAQLDPSAPRNGLGEEIANLDGRLETLQTEFGKLAAGVARAEFDSIEKPTFDIQREIQEVLRPIFRDLNDATTGLRQLDELRTRREFLRQREQLANSAVERLRALHDAAGDEVLKSRLEGMLKSWEGRALEESTQGRALQLQIEEQSKSDVSIFRRMSQGAMLFCKTRGKNLLLALVALVAVYGLFRWAYRFVKKLSPLHRGKASFMARLMDVVYSVISLIVGLIAAFAVLYTAGDWVLMMLGLLFVLGVLWASKNTLPHVYEQTKLMLNLGPVREGERLIYDGLPWRVDTLGLYCEFSNPELTGGQLRLPIRALVDLHSRPFTDKEPWFPTSLKDWVRLSDGNFGRVVVQTPEQIEMVRLGGARLYYQAAAFLGLAPENLSKNFRISVVFGIDYDHQARSTTDIPDLFQERLQNELEAAVDEDQLINLRVEFKEAGASSLDYEIMADFSGELAARYNTLQRMISRVCVDVCNENEFVIPFTQITVHQAGA